MAKRLQPTPKTVKRLFALSGNICAFPDCVLPIVEPDGTLVGDICHINAASPEGARYKKSQTHEKRRSFENLVLFCKIHHPIIDNKDNEKAYPDSLVEKYKNEHEAKYTNSVNQFKPAKDILEKAVTQAIKNLEEKLINVMNTGFNESKERDEKLMDMVKDLGSRMDKIGGVSTDSDSINGKEELKTSSELIQQGKLQEARDLLLPLIGEPNIKSNKKLIAKIFNNIGVSYRLEVDKNLRSKAEDFFKKAIASDTELVKAKGNLIFYHLALHELNKTPLESEVFEDAYQLWLNAKDDKDFALRTYMAALYYKEGPKKTLELIRGDKKIFDTISKSYDLRYFYSGILIDNQLVDESIAVLDSITKEYKSSDVLYLKTTAHLIKAQSGMLLPYDSIIPEFKDFSQVDVALDTSMEALKLTDKQSNPYIYEQLRLAIATIWSWKRGTFEATEVLNEEINPEYIPPRDRHLIDLSKIVKALLSKDFQHAYNLLVKDNPNWDKVSLNEKHKILRTFIKYGGIEQAKSLSNLIFKEYEEDKVDSVEFIELLFTASVIFALCNDRVDALKTAQDGVDKIRNSNSNKNTLINGLSHLSKMESRYAGEIGGDKLIQTASELQELKPDEVIIRPMNILNDNNEFTDDFKKIIETKTEYINKVRNTYFENPITIYWLDKTFNRSFIEIFSDRGDNDFALITRSTESKIIESFSKNLETATSISLDYLSLFNLASIELLGALTRLNKKILIGRKLFDEIQMDLLDHENAILRSIWDFIRLDPNVEIVEYIGNIPKDINKLKLPEWLSELIAYCREKDTTMIIDDLRLATSTNLEKNCKVSNTQIIIDYLKTKTGSIDDRQWPFILKNLAKNLNSFISFNENDLFDLVTIEDFKVTISSYHLVNQINLPGSQADTFLYVYRNFLTKLWASYAKPVDKVEWLKTLLNLHIKSLKRNYKDLPKENLDKIKSEVEIMAEAIIDVILSSNEEELNLIEEFFKKTEDEYLAKLKETFPKIIELRRDTLKKGTKKD